MIFLNAVFCYCPPPSTRLRADEAFEVLVWVQLSPLTHVHLCSSSGLQACMSLPPACALMVQSKHLVWMPPHLHFSGYEPRQQADVATDVPLNVFGLLCVCLILLNWFGQTSFSPISTHCSVWRSEFPTGGGGGSDDLMSADPDLPRFSDLRSVLQSHGRIIGVFLLLYDGFQLTPHKQPTPTHTSFLQAEKKLRILFSCSVCLFLFYLFTLTHTHSHMVNTRHFFVTTLPALAVK